MPQLEGAEKFVVNFGLKCWFGSLGVYPDSSGDNMPQLGGADNLDVNFGLKFWFGSL